MSASTPPNSSARDEAHADLFAELVMQHANMALIFVGAVPHPETGKPVQDLEAAQLFIDRLEMLEAKTRGNLSGQEAALLKQSLAASRMAFVQAVQSDEQAAQAATAPPPSGPPWNPTNPPPTPNRRRPPPNRPGMPRPRPGGG